MSPLAWPPSSLVGFPNQQLSATDELVRIHLHGQSPWWFSHDGSGRFDLAAPSGTCYLAEEGLGAFIEVFRDTRVIPDIEIDARRISTLAVEGVVRLADCTSSEAAAFGVTAEIHSGDDYVKTQTWAAAFATAGYGGVRYLASHDPSQRRICIAVFGAAGEARLPILRTAMIGKDLINAAEKLFGIRVIPLPRK